MSQSQSKRILGLIPVRLKSTRLDHKPLIEIQGQTLLERTYRNIEAMGLFDRLIILADDPLVEREAKRIGALCYLTPEDCNSGMERAAAFHETNPEVFDRIDLIVHVQCDEPMVKKSSIEALISGYNRDSQVTTLCAKIDGEHAKDPSNVKCVFDRSGKALYFSRSVIPMYRGQEEDFYHKHIGIYAYAPHFLPLFKGLKTCRCESAEMLEHLKILEHGYSIQVCEVDDIPIGIDTPADVKHFEDALCQQNISL